MKVVSSARPERFSLSSEQCELLHAFERAPSLQALAKAVGREISVVSRQLQKLAEAMPVIEKAKGRWQITALGRQMSYWAQDAIEGQRRIYEQFNNARLSGFRAPAIHEGTVLMIINVQDGFDDPRWGPRNNLDAEANIAKLLARWREEGRPVVFVQHQSVEPRSPLRARSKATEIKRIVRPRKGELILEKSRNCAFMDTDLAARLQALDAKSLVFTGIPLDHCVDSTVRMASDLGYSCFVVADATVSFDRVAPDGKVLKASALHLATLTSLNQEFAAVVETRALLEQLKGPGP
jgi:nicotinamidase-related amidase